MHHFSDVQLRRVVRTLLERAGSESAEAAQVADHLVDANLRGHDSHGIGMIPHYVHNITNQTMRRYQNEHLPDAVNAFSAAGAWRGWSDVDDDVHLAFYEFADLAEVNRVMASDALKQMIGEFDRHWQGKVTRTREVVESIQAI